MFRGQDPTTWVLDKVNSKRIKLGERCRFLISSRVGLEVYRQIFILNEGESSAPLSAPVPPVVLESRRAPQDNENIRQISFSNLASKKEPHQFEQ